MLQPKLFESSDDVTTAGQWLHEGCARRESHLLLQALGHDDGSLHERATQRSKETHASRPRFVSLLDVRQPVEVTPAGLCNRDKVSSGSAVLNPRGCSRLMCQHVAQGQCDMLTVVWLAICTSLIGRLTPVAMQVQQQLRGTANQAADGNRGNPGANHMPLSVHPVAQSACHAQQPVGEGSDSRLHYKYIKFNERSWCRPHAVVCSTSGTI